MRYNRITGLNLSDLPFSGRFILYPLFAAESELYANRVWDGRASTFAEGSVNFVHIVFSFSSSARSKNVSWQILFLFSDVS